LDASASLPLLSSGELSCCHRERGGGGSRLSSLLCSDASPHLDFNFTNGAVPDIVSTNHMNDTKPKFNVSEAALKAQEGASYSVDKYVEGVDYVKKKCFKSYKLSFREGLVIPKVVDSIPQVTESTKVDNIKLDDVTSKLDSEEVLTKITRFHPNPRFIETTVGRIIVNKLGLNLHVNQLIRVKGGVMCTNT